MTSDHGDEAVVTRRPNLVATPGPVPTATSQETMRTDCRHVRLSGAVTAAGLTVTGVDVAGDRSRPQHGTHHG